MRYSLGLSTAEYNADGTRTYYAESPLDRLLVAVLTRRLASRLDYELQRGRPVTYDSFVEVADQARAVPSQPLCARHTETLTQRLGTLRLRADAASMSSTHSCRPHCFPFSLAPCWAC